MSGLLERLESKKGGRRTKTAAGKVVRPEGDTGSAETIVVEAPIKLDDLEVVSLGGVAPPSPARSETPDPETTQPSTSATPQKTPPWLTEPRRPHGALHALVPRALALIEERRHQTPLPTGDMATIRAAVDSAAQGLTREMRLTADDRALAASEISDFLWGYGPLTPLFDDTAITDIWIDRFDSIACRRRGETLQTPFRFLTAEMYHRFVDRITGRCAATSGVDHLSISLPDRWHTRLDAAFPPLVHGFDPRLSFRIPRFAHATMYELVRAKTVPVKFGAWLAEAAHSAAAHIIVVGPPGSGRTTIVTALLAAIGSAERLATIETVAEIFPPAVNLDKLVGPAARHEDLVPLVGRRAAVRLALGDLGAGAGAPFRSALRSGWRGIIGTLDAPDTETAIATLRSFSALPTSATLVLEMCLESGSPCLNRAREIVFVDGAVAAMPLLVSFQGGSDTRRRWETSSVETPLRRRIVPAGIAPGTPVRTSAEDALWQKS